jgi:hypothetical protein
MHYHLFVPAQAVGANLVYFDLFNAAGSGKTVNVKSVVPVVSGASAVTGTVAVDLFLTRTTAIGTGGTAATREGSSLTAATISALDGDQPADANVTARLTPSGGATAGAVLSTRSVFTEETADASYSRVSDMVRSGDNSVPSLAIKPGKGVRVVQGSVASVGNIGFDVVFELVDL